MCTEPDDKCDEPLSERTLDELLSEKAINIVILRKLHRADDDARIEIEVAKIERNSENLRTAMLSLVRSELDRRYVQKKIWILSGEILQRERDRMHAEYEKRYRNSPLSRLRRTIAKFF